MLWLDSSREGLLFPIMESVYVAGHGELLDRDLSPDEEKIKSLAKSRPAGSRFIIDIENLPTVHADAAIVKNSYAVLANVADAISVWGKGLKLGIYGVPGNTYWPIVNHWLSASVEHAVKPWYLANAAKHRVEFDQVLESFRWFKDSTLATYLDFVCPSLYAPYCDIDAVAPSTNDLHRQWETWATTTILMYRPTYLPVIPFIWHRANAAGWPFISQPFWRQMLATVKAHADGAVIWRAKDGAGEWANTLKGML